VLLWRLSIIREVLLSGFQLELYAEDEKSFVYWELSQVNHEHLATLDALEPVIPKGELVHEPTIRSETTDWQIPKPMENLTLHTHILMASGHFARECSL